jgi:hypothetical protein
MRQLAQAGWHAHAFPLSVDGIEIVASLVLLADRRAGRKSVWLPWAALAIGTAGSLAANVATAGPGIISPIIAGRPALALLIAWTGTAHPGQARYRPCQNPRSDPEPASRRPGGP